MSDIDTQRLARQTMAFVLAGGRGSRLKELTDRRTKPAVYFGGKTRIIDFALSNAFNSGIRRVGVATQYKAHSLIRHLQRGWSFFRAERNESLDILPASQQLPAFVGEWSWRFGLQLRWTRLHPRRWRLGAASERKKKKDDGLIQRPRSDPDNKKAVRQESFRT